ncbi:MAG: putative chemoreceptor glutamine deamidase CheD [Armatimonadota bacterium]|nr:MAG: putative chemoreceptor glutamine deamidase CheD [Armatimonadota bacterium]
MGVQLTVGMGEIQVVRGVGNVLTALGLGSCIGVCLYDPLTRVAGMVHVVLPKSQADKTGELPGKFADTAIPAIVQRMVEQGANVSRLKAAIAGGAQLFQFGVSNSLDVGARNAEAVVAALREAGISLQAKDVGGNAGRTLRLVSDNGLVVVRAIGGAERELVVLGNIFTSSGVAA